MAADANGMDLAAVGVILSGRLFIAPDGTAMPAQADLEDDAWVLPVAFEPMGLITTDGGFEWTLEPDGDATEFFQDGYTLPTGLANASLKTTLAQTDNTVRSVLWGATPSVGGYVEIDAGGHADRYVLYAEEIFKDGRIRRRVGKASVSAVAEVKSERGAVKGYETTFKIERSADLNNKHLGEAVLAAA